MNSKRAQPGNNIEKSDKKRKKLDQRRALQNILDHENLLKEVLSFCDFRILMTLRRTCKKLKTLSDWSLDQCVQTVMQKLPVERQEADGSWENVTWKSLENGWSEEFKSKDALIEEALTYCNPGGEVSLENYVNYDVDRARYLLRTRGAVDVEHFLGEDDEDFDEGVNEVGWNVRINFLRGLTSQLAARYVLGKTTGETEELLIRHCTLCLLRVATTIRFGRCKYDYRHTDYPKGCKMERLMFEVPNHGEVEFSFQEKYEVL